MLSLRIMNPDGALPHSYRCDQRTIGSNRTTILLRGPEGDLLRLTVRKTLPPEVIRPVDASAKIHPPPVRRPARRGAGTSRAHRPAVRAAVERNQAARQPTRFHLSY